jgi:hypothetical protein
MEIATVEIFSSVLSGCPCAKFKWQSIVIVAMNEHALYFRFPVREKYGSHITL